MSISLPEAYSKYLDKAYTIKSLTAPAFKGKFNVVGGTTKTFKIFSINPTALKDYSARKSRASSATFGYEYEDAGNTVQTVTARNDKYFALHIDKGDATFAKDGSLDARAHMKAQIEEVVIPEIDKYNIGVLADAVTANNTITAATDTTNAYEKFSGLMTLQTNALVPRSGRVAFVTATEFAKLKLDPKFSVPSELTAHSRRSGNYGMIDGALIIEIPDSYMPAKTSIILSHSDAAAAPKYLTDYKQGEYTSEGSGYYVNGRVIYDAFVFDKKKTAVAVLKSA